MTFLNNIAISVEERTGKMIQKIDFEEDINLNR